MKRYLVIYEQADDGGWGAHSPDVEGVFALGSTRGEVEERMAEALAAHLEYVRGVHRSQIRTQTPGG
jgi:predicted RNase H-like HicB family nuclease